mmetsp:Transcript_43126/g.91923  ORF Transcript_43126/g.91923 Transcript_43126/m.91923 type:complete len:212 (+) Transcript_43126:848-1483(+)
MSPWMPPRALRISRTCFTKATTWPSAPSHAAMPAGWRLRLRMGGCSPRLRCLLASRDAVVGRTWHLVAVAIPGRETSTCREAGGAQEGLWSRARKSLVLSLDRPWPPTSTTTTGTIRSTLWRTLCAVRTTLRSSGIGARTGGRARASWRWRRSSEATCWVRRQLGIRCFSSAAWATISIGAGPTGGPGRRNGSLPITPLCQPARCTRCLGL